MLSINIAVAPGENVEATAGRRLLYQAHIKRLHLARPLNLTITPISDGMRTVAQVMDLSLEDHEYYKVESETVGCPAT